MQPKLMLRNRSTLQMVVTQPATEYRGREATDFKEENIELFKDIADKVKQTNSYDLAFDELEKKKTSCKSLSKTMHKLTY